MQSDLTNQVISEVLSKFNVNQNQIEQDLPKTNPINNNPSNNCSIPEFIGVSPYGDTIGLVIAHVDQSLAKVMKLNKDYKSLGIIGSRTGAGPQILAADEGVKASNTELLSIELPRDTKGGAGHGSLIIFGSNEVGDCKEAVAITLKNLERTMGDVYSNEAGHLEFQYTANASYACNKIFSAPLNRAYGLILGAPAAIGVVIADLAVKSANVEVINYGSPTNGTSFSNESYVSITGDTASVKQAIFIARDAGLKLLGAMGETPKSNSKPYIL